MTAVALSGGASGGGLAEALEALSEDHLDTEEQLQARLIAIQEACTGLIALVQRDGRVPTDLLENALEAVVRGLGSARAKLEAAGGQLEAMRMAEWSQATLAAADMCLHSEAWHAAWHADVGAGGKEAYLRTVGLVRDMLRDDLLPLLCAAAAQQTAETGFLLAAQYQAVLAMGCTAAEVVGMRDPRHRHPGLRNFSVLNVLWNGIQRLWATVPAEARPEMERQGLGAAALVQQLLGFIRKDLRACHQLLDPGMGKLLQYWVQKAKFVLSDYPSAAPACWAPLLEVPVCAHRELALLLEAAAGNAAGGGAAALAETLRTQVIPKAVSLLAACLSWTTAEDQLRVMLDALRMRLSAGSSDAGSESVHALRAVLQLLHAAPSMPLAARHHCVAVLGSVLEALPGPAFSVALEAAELREQVADAAFAFLAGCCHTAISAAGNPALQAWECQLSAQTWERCQQLLFRHALQPHPLTAHVLGSVWSDLAAASSDELFQSHVTMLHDLLRLTAAAEAVVDGHTPSSPLYMQLLGLLACLLAAAPPAMLDAYYANFLQVLPSMQEDVCQLACLAAELRLATLVDVARGSSAAAPQAGEVLGGLLGLLHEAGPLVIKRLPKQAGPGVADGTAGSDDGCAYLAWLLDALQGTVAYFASTGLQAPPDCQILPSRLGALLCHAMNRNVFSFASPALAGLRDLQSLGLLETHDLASLVPVLVACLGRPEAAAAAAELIPALATCAAPHMDVVHLALTAPPPLLQHLGLEAFRLYALACPRENVPKAVPPSARDPVTKEVLPGFASLLAQYTQRSAAGGPAQLQDQEAAAWAAALRQEALGAAAGLRRAVEAYRSAAAAAQSEAEAAGCGVDDGGHGHANAPSQGGTGQHEQRRQDVAASEGEGAGAVAAAAEQLARAVSQLGAALRHAPLDAATAHALQQCATQLGQLLGAG